MSLTLRLMIPNSVPFNLQGVRRVALIGTLSAGFFLGGATSAQVVKAPRYKGATAPDAPTQQLNLPPLPPALTPHGTVVEDVVVRVNDQIISRSDVERAAATFDQDVAQNHIAPAEAATLQRNMLRDMIDKQLLLSRAKDLGLNADADVIRQLDDIRKQNHMDSLDDLEKAAKQQGISFEDFKAQIRNQILTQQVVRDEVGRRLQMSTADETAYYEAHKADYMLPEQVKLSEILVPLPETATPIEIAAAQGKANDLKTRVMQGEPFADVAKKSSGGPTAAQGGELGVFKRGSLAKVLEDETFALKVGDSTQPIRTRQGFVILKVTGHDMPGPAPMSEVDQQIQEALYMNAMQPALRAYLSKLRDEAYIDVQPGFIDSGATSKETKPIFSAYAPPPVKKKKLKQTVRYDRHRNGAPVISSPDTTGGRTLTGAEAQGVPAPSSAPTPAANAAAESVAASPSDSSTSPAIDPATGLAVLTPAAATTPAVASSGSAPSGSAQSGSAPAKLARNKTPKLMKKEKIRFGQAPRNSLSTGTDDTPLKTTDGGAVPVNSGEATLGSLTTATVSAPNNGAPPAESTSASANLDDNPLTPVAPERSKTRFAARAKEVQAAKVKTLSAKKQEKIDAKPVAMTANEASTAKVQAAALGLSGDTSKKTKKPAKVKGAPKVRLEEKKPEVKQAPAEIDQTASPTLAPTASTPASQPARSTRPTQSQQVPNSSVPRPASNIPNDTTLPPVTQPTPGQAQPGTPVPPPGI